jgi:hypothetical protein
VVKTAVNTNRKRSGSYPEDAMNNKFERREI